MTPKEISERLVALQSALVEKTGEQPFLEPTLTTYQTGTCAISLHRAYNEGDYNLGRVTGKTFAETLDAADKFVAALPDPDEAKKRTFQKNLGKVIDEGNSLAMPVEVMQPLSDASKALSENLLTYEGSDQ